MSPARGEAVVLEETVTIVDSDKEYAMSNNLIAVTGATGHVGGALARELRARGVAVRVIGRSAERLQPLTALGAEAAVGSQDDPEFLARAFTGASAVFALIPPDYTAPDQRAYQRRIGDRLAVAIEKAGVPRAVSLSSVGAELESGTGPIAGLHDLEKRLESVRGLHILHLRPTYFMENHLFGIGLIKGQGIYGSPLKADLAFAQIATRDIGAVAADVLREPTFTGRSVRDLQGPRDYSMREATRILGESIGKPDLPYVEFPYDATRQALTGMGFSADAAVRFVEMYDGFNVGRVKPTQARSASTTTPTTLEQLAKDTFAPAFKG
jgi:uncharacterized protein YbjT (DUF2867 family)